MVKYRDEKGKEISTNHRKLEEKEENIIGK